MSQAKVDGACGRVGVLFVVATGLAFPGLARASGLDSPQVGSAASGPLTSDAAAIHWNPGQLGFLEQPELSAGLGLIVGDVRYQRERLGDYQYADNLEFAEPVPQADIDPTRSGSAAGIKANPVGPNLDIFFAMPVVPDRFALGVGLYLPYTALLDMPRDGAQRFQAQSITQIAAFTTVSAAVKLHDVISIGAGISYVLGYLDQSKVQDFAAVDVFADGLSTPPINQANDFGPNAPSTVRELDVLARQTDITRAFAHGVSFNVGVALRPTDKLRLALVYQHGAKLRFRGKFQINMDDDFFTQDLAAQGLQYPAVVKGDAEVRFRLPKRIIVGTGYQIARRFGLDAMLSWVFYSDFDKIVVDFDSPGLAQPGLGLGPKTTQPLVRDWQGTLLAELTGRVQATDKLGLTVLLGYHMPASPDSTVDMASPDGHRLVFGTGMSYAFNERISVLADFEGQAIVPRTVTDSDYDLGNGTYRLFVGHFGVHGRFRFGQRARGRRKPGRPPPAAS